MRAPRRLLPQPLRRRDLALVGVVTLLEVIELRTGPEADPPSAAVGVLVLLLSLAQGVPLLWRRRHPWPVLAIVTAAFVLHALVHVPVPPYGGWVALATLAVRRDARSAAGAAGLLVAACCLAYLPAEGPADDLAMPVFVTVVVAVSAQLLRERRARAEALTDRAAAEERLRIARDLHDVLGHSLSGIAVQSSTGRLALDAGQAGPARDALVAIEAASRDSMREVREVLGLLRDSGGTGLESLDDLVRSAQATGLVVTVSRHGDLRDLPRPTSAAAYRVAQEALTNVTRHAGACRVTLSVRRAPDAVVVEVLDDGRGASAVSGPPGHGLVGMRERVTAAGGTLSAGPEPAGGWRVRAELPLVAEEAT